jgi:chromosome segregation ATPase
LPRDVTVRARIAEYLATNGPIEDSSGRATSRLKTAVAYAGGDQAFSQIMSSMADAGELIRDVRGKRTYRISVSASKEAALSASKDATVDRVMDYDELAASLLAQVTQVLSASERDKDKTTGSADPAAWARRRIDQLELRIATLQRDLASARADVQVVADERDELRGRLEAATHNLQLMTDRMEPPRRTARPAIERLGAGEQALLHQLGGHRRTPSHATS